MITTAILGVGITAEGAVEPANVPPTKVFEIYVGNLESGKIIGTRVLLV